MAMTRYATAPELAAVHATVTALAAVKFASGTHFAAIAAGLAVVQIPLPAGRFTAAPTATVTPVVDDPNRFTNPVIIRAVTTTHIEIGVRMNGAYPTIGFSWIAIGS